MELYYPYSGLKNEPKWLSKAKCPFDSNYCIFLYNLVKFNDLGKLTWLSLHPFHFINIDKHNFHSYFSNSIDFFILGKFDLSGYKKFQLSKLTGLSFP